MGKKNKNITGNKYVDDLIDDIVPRKRNKLSRKQLIFRLTIYSILWVILLCSMLFTSSIEQEINRIHFNFDPALASSDYKVHFVDVGQGDCTIIELPDNKIVMIDNGKNRTDVRENVLRYIDSLHITVIDYLILTHTDADHIGNTKPILDKCKVLNAYIPKVYSNYEKQNNLNKEAGWKLKETRIWDEAIKSIYDEKCNIIRNEADIEIKSDRDEDPTNDIYNLKFYTPSKEIYSDWNSYSPIIIARIFNKRFMLTADAPQSEEREFIANKGSDFVDCDVLKVGHHGSDTSTNIDFLEIVNPEVAVISCGDFSTYGHPDPDTLNKLDEFSKNFKDGKLKVYITHNDGSVTIGAGEEDVNSEVVSQANYNRVSDTYLEWKYFVIVGGVILIIGFVFVIHTGKEKKEK